MRAPQATGRLATHDDGVYVLLDRIFSAPIEDVWASLTRKERLELWIGTWKGSPDTGAISFLMTGEENADWQDVAILNCDAPHRLELDVNPGPESQRIYLDVTEAAGRTVVTLGQRLKNPRAEASIGVGWDFYLDRLVASRNKEPLAAWDDYYPALVPHYQNLADELDT